MFPDRFGQSLFMESKLSNNKRDKLKDSEFGIPDKRAYPLNDKSHVEAAVRMFPHADDSDKKELAKRIISKAKEFNMDTSGWDSLNEYIQESVSNNDVLNACKDLAKEWSHFRYGIPYNGKLSNIPSAEWFNENYHFLSPEEFERCGGGVCWDFVEWGAKFLDKKGVRYHQYYIYTNTKDEDTHTIILCEYNGKWIYPEGSFELVANEINGVALFDDIKEVFEFITSRMFEVNNNASKYKSFKYYVWSYKGHPPYGCNAREYTEYVTQGEPFLEGVAYNNIIQESVERINDKGESIPEICDKCGSKIGLYLKGEPVWLCSNKDCNKYYGTPPCHVQESMLQDIKNGVNPNSKKLFFHISLDKDLNGKTFKPRIPSYLTKKSNNDSNGYKEDKTTPRVCFSPSIEGCLRAILSAEKNLDIVGERIYVYIPDKPISEYKVKTNKEIIKEKLVFDAKMTKEMWILEPVKLKLYGVIYVDQVKNIRQSETLEGDPIGKVDYKWHWAVSPKYVDGIIDWMDEKDKTETIQEAMVDVAFNNLRCKIADALGDKYKVSNIIHNSLNSAKDKFTVALSSNTSKFVNVVNDTTGVSVLGYLRNISMSHAFDRLMEFFTSPEFVNESATIKIKEEFYMSDFVRDPSILRMFQEAKDSDEDEKEEEIDENLDESSEDIVDDDSEEPTTFGSDTSDVQNEYNPKDVEALNNLIAAENDAMNDYFEAGKNTNDDVLTRLYADIGAEERFHAEQLLYAKSVLTGEKYEPRDPEVKKEYEELLEMGMDEETAMTTAVDRLNIMKGSDEDIDLEEMEDELSVTESMLYMNSDQFEIMMMICESDKYDINEFCDDIETFTESYYIEGAVNVNDGKQVKEFKAKQDPMFFIAKSFKNLFGLAIQMVKISKKSIRALTVKRRNIADFIQKNGIKGLFAKGISLYFYDMKNPNNIDMAPIQYCDFLYRLTMVIAKEVGYNMENLSFNILNGGLQRIQFKNIEQGLNIVKGITLTKTKIIVNDENEDQIAKLFFGYTKNKVGVIKEKENGYEIQHKSENIYTYYENISNIVENCSKNCQKFVEYMEKLDSDVNSVKYKDKNKYNQVLNSMKIVNKGFDIFIKALAHDMKTIMNMFNQMANETQAKDLEDNAPEEHVVTKQQEKV